MTRAAKPSAAALAAALLLAAPEGARAQNALPPDPPMVSSQTGAVAPDCRPGPAVAPLSPPAFPGVAVDPAWPREAYLLTDSVVLGAQYALIQKFRAACWSLRMDGKPAIMLPTANAHLKKYPALPPVAIMAIGYNSLWEKERRNYAKWAARFDAEAEQILKTLAERGVKKVVWVKIREISEENVPMSHSDARAALRLYSHYFPYVNERLRLLRERHPGLALVDWTTAGAGLGYTYDAIHLNPVGAAVMTFEIMRTLGIAMPADAPPTPRAPTTPRAPRSPAPAAKSGS